MKKAPPGGETLPDMISMNSYSAKNTDLDTENVINPTNISF